MFGVGAAAEKIQIYKMASLSSAVRRERILTAAERDL